MVHWVTAISIFMLIITGLGQMPVYGRYLLIQPFGTKWLLDYNITLVVHYIFAIILIFIVFYHLAYHLMRKEFDIIPRKGDVRGSIEIIKCMITKEAEPPCDKYLPEQRLAYLAFAIPIALVIVTGVIKVVKNVMGIQATDGVLYWAAQLHNLAMVLIIFAIVAHLGAFVVKANRKMLPGMFTGYVDEEYVEERHSIWYKKLQSKKEKKQRKVQ